MDFRRHSSPPLHLWTATDSAFINNPDTIFVRLFKSNHLFLTCTKLPFSEAYGEVRYYNSSSDLSKIEIWNIRPVAQHENDFVTWNDASNWFNRKKFKDDELVKEIQRSIVYVDQKGFAYRTTTIRYKDGLEKRRKTRDQYF